MISWKKISLNNPRKGYLLLYRKDFFGGGVALHSPPHLRPAGYMNGNIEGVLIFNWSAVTNKGVHNNFLELTTGVCRNKSLGRGLGGWAKFELKI